MTTVSVPLRGLWFLSTVTHFEPLKRMERFRPLTGIMVLISAQYCPYGVHVSYVSVPLRGLWFLSARYLS